MQEMQEGEKGKTQKIEVKNPELWCCHYCGSKDDCEYVWDPYNEWQTVEEAKHKICLAMK